MRFRRRDYGAQLEPAHSLSRRLTGKCGDFEIARALFVWKEAVSDYCATGQETMSEFRSKLIPHRTLIFTSKVSQA